MGEVTLQYRGSVGASVVEVAGDWTQWQGRAMELVGEGIWQVRAQLSAGKHQFKYMVDGQWWEWSCGGQGYHLVADDCGNLNAEMEVHDYPEFSHSGPLLHLRQTWHQHRGGKHAAKTAGKRRSAPAPLLPITKEDRNSSSISETRPQGTARDGGRPNLKPLDLAKGSGGLGNRSSKPSSVAAAVPTVKAPLPARGSPKATAWQSQNSASTTSKNATSTASKRPPNAPSSTSATAATRGYPNASSKRSPNVIASTSTTSVKQATTVSSKVLSKAPSENLVSSKASITTKAKAKSVTAPPVGPTSAAAASAKSKSKCTSSQQSIISMKSSIVTSTSTKASRSENLQTSTTIASTTSSKPGTTVSSTSTSRATKNVSTKPGHRGIPLKLSSNTSVAPTRASNLAPKITASVETNKPISGQEITGKIR